MPATVILGAQWGDEGKGKAIDQLAPQSTWAVRFQGGNNAGHTIVVGDTTLKLHQIPSGVTAKHCNLVLGDGMVIDPWVLDEELGRWEDLTGEKPDGERLFISERASVILPFHRLYDGADKVVGTTGRGIGPAYRDRIERVGIRFADIPGVLADPKRIKQTISRMNSQLKTVKVETEVSADELTADLQWILDRFGQAIRPTGLMVDLALRNGENVLLEGAQGAMLDIDQGTYPFVTSSVVGRANASHGAGIHPGHVTECFGITKAYCTRVGNGPFPTELSLEEGPGHHMAQIGHEFGTTTGRPRRTGWLDIVALKDADRTSGYSGLVVTKLDVLGGLDEIKICVGYELDGKPISYVPTLAEDLDRCVAVYETHSGFPAMSDEDWIDMAERSRTEGSGFAAMPDAVRNIVDRIEQLSGISVVCVGVGPDRRASIARKDGPFDIAWGEATF
ncbi:adenylosuccinate synthase [Candidatus Poseidoniales archaeon]|uniref:Adenylosuccinate synthetase n=1 Tax=uncultured marine group II/III euryarchaeote AD1000_58_G05 TaxID=1457790 RepID=A0A075FV22_9EURY|nr:adenylosuccinate synthetase (purA) [uncultured marine group II/III euryarchaeote AD1000_58_G05]MDC0040202.1 adenylosuccinate synthase [Candidatus Poseidoniales archaeon]MDC0149768.1 adenylosuccinate synthase [Candidatus Poseidoniales archaeon]MDP6886230.1 adenylosuccinate synthase [Candidatus Thalassarchaeaceae archaeon]